MYQKREDLDIIFRRTSPETVQKKIRQGDLLIERKEQFSVDFDKYSAAAFDHYARLNLPQYSQTEIEMRSESLNESMKQIKGESIYSLLTLYADKVLHYNGSCLFCRREEILNWHSIYLRLGQDIFTTSWFAWRYRNECPDKMKNQKFTWPAVLKTNDDRLNHILDKGLAENHFHLHGSTQVFALSWACLMNHPSDIYAFLNSTPQFKNNLNSNLSGGVWDNVMDWETRILYAAMIRAVLFECCLGILSGEELQKIYSQFDILPLASDVREHTELLRYCYGEKFKQMNGKKKCLDYAVCSKFYFIDENDDNRLLAGERNFLYQCFHRFFRGKASRLESELLYLYLLIKSNFRSELVQNNDRYGFQNFLNYQDRKDQLFEKYEEYWTESLRLSICAGIKENRIQSPEARIMPGISRSGMRDKIRGLDRRVEFSQGKEKNQPNDGKPKKERLPYYYVTHFAKMPLSEKEFSDRYLSLVPRNDKVRRKIKKQAKALDQYMHTCDSYDQRIWGIDACSMEIGCRPETFATEIRFLRTCARDNMEIPWYQDKKKVHQEIGVTYHVGEDFLDIADGLRATDEAVTFLCMERGDRIGHGLVLGIDPKEYYENKKYIIYLRKQDYLDNLVWILYRSIELEVTISEYARTFMRDQAVQLLSEIYPNVIDISTTNGAAGLLDLYYRSWQLRGDHPDLYISGEYKPYIKLSESNYDNHKIPGGLQQYHTGNDKLMIYRENKCVAHFCYLYHFDSQSKRNGFQVIDFHVKKWYVTVMEAMQQAMRMEIFKRGICIECNPTSNVLIGTFKSYIKHPILKFNNYHLDSNSEHLNISVSINTDDLGVFDTSLQNEYALILAAVCRYRHENGNYNDDAVYDYLDYLRQNGIDMAFYRKND